MDMNKLQEKYQKVDADYKVELSAIRPDQRMTSRIIRIGLYIPIC